MYSIGLAPHTIYWVDYIARGLDQGVAAGGAQWVLVGIGAVTGADRGGVWLGYDVERNWKLYAGLPDRGRRNGRRRPLLAADLEKK
jgi:hypothetical protein